MLFKVISLPFTFYKQLFKTDPSTTVLEQGNTLALKLI